ncbi:hypothetical protein [Photobacterium leiognathi]|uniref:hypothetical protein n=1 Tax=Photobacterium leiognathi TaxID=553611 RepID=UPI002980B279|nr:hypothetical protein [Photobacterium leiognathi]
MSKGTSLNIVLKVVEDEYDADFFFNTVDKVFTLEYLPDEVIMLRVENKYRADRKVEWIYKFLETVSINTTKYAHVLNFDDLSQLTI